MLSDNDFVNSIRHFLRILFCPQCFKIIMSIRMDFIRNYAFFAIFSWKRRIFTKNCTKIIDEKQKKWYIKTCKKHVCF